ncbi:hypothetical protein BaRGS_00028746, partial [Batillaria attramentaria]
MAMAVSSSLAQGPSFDAITAGPGLRQYFYVHYLQLTQGMRTSLTGVNWGRLSQYK